MILQSGKQTERQLKAYMGGEWHMYDISAEFNKFYRNKVVLRSADQHKLREKKKLNISRLKSGLQEYNEEKGTSYKICEERVQGSMAMHTVVQNDEKDYDIDVAIVFEKENLGEMGARAARNMVANALRRKTGQFAEEPEVKTSCVRVKYQEGYHVDFAIYRRYRESGSGEHAGADWTKRGIRAVEDWFRDETAVKGINLRKVVRLSKMFCRSRDTWVMPSGLLQTVLCDEQLHEHDRIDELFYDTMERIVNRLETVLAVNAPVDNGRSLTSRDADLTRMRNWKNRLSTQLEKLSILFSDDCTYAQALDAWSGFFQHDYWTSLAASAVTESCNLCESQSYQDTEQFIEDMYPVDEQYDVVIDCQVIGQGIHLIPIQEFFHKFASAYGRYLPRNFKVKCSIRYTNTPVYDEVLWKVRNVGSKAEARDDIRGQIQSRGQRIEETTIFEGPHYIECYLIKDGICVAIGHVDVPIGLS